MKLIGDVPEEHKYLAAELEKMEKRFDEATGKGSDNSQLAKGYTCLAHDWYMMGAEEEGLRLLHKADKVFPTYFESQIIVDCLHDLEFNFIVRNITTELMFMAVSKLEERK